ncbi:DUF2793 domain-containing protein [Sphingopyxis terrae]|uniref:DUF2793 domain-containing protein n=1 Tax=Sphingopyxis terrae TaxID=33052 RepID=UPI003F7E96D7
MDGAATGAWASEAGRLALWTAGGWRIVAPFPGCVSDGSATVPRYVSAAPNGLYPSLLRIPTGVRRSTWKRVRQ